MGRSPIAVLSRIQQKASQVYRTIVLPEGWDPRVVQAAARIDQEGLARVVLLGKPLAISALADDHRLKLSNITVVDPDKSPHMEAIRQRVSGLKFAAELTPEELDDYLLNPVHQGAGMVSAGIVDGMVTGADTSSSEVARTAIKVVGLAPGSSLVSSSFLMIPPSGGTAFTFADCGVVPDPDAQQLAAIAGDAQRLHQQLTGQSPRVAFLSFSSKGSAEHPRVEKVRQATALFRERYPDVPADGELQVDAALIPSVAARKAPQSSLEGQANVLIFPDLDAGNIGYKLTERMGGFTALGPLLQGLARPVHDMSRGCSVEDIVNITAIAALQSASG